MKQAVLNQVTICADGSIGLQWLKQVRDPDSGEVLFSEPHRSTIDVGVDIDAQMAAVTEHFGQMGYAAGEAADAELVREALRTATEHPRIAENRNAKLEQKAAALDQQVAELTNYAEAAIELAVTEAEAKVRQETGEKPEREIAAVAAEAVADARAESQKAFDEQIAPIKAEAKRLRRLKS